MSEGICRIGLQSLSNNYQVLSYSTEVAPSQPLALVAWRLAQIRGELGGEKKGPSPQAIQTLDP